MKQMFLLCLIVADRTGARPIERFTNPQHLHDEIMDLRATVAQLAAVMKGRSVEEKPHPPPPPPPCSKDGPMMWPCSSLETKHPSDPTLQFKRVMVVQAHPDDESMGSGLIGKVGTLYCIFLLSD